MIETEQSGRRIRTAATDAAAHGQNFVDPDVDTKRRAGLFLKFFRRAHDQVAVVRHAGEFGVQLNHAIIAHGEK
jgi:hypothetical protein